MVIDAKELYGKIDEYMDKEVVLEGWVRNHRKQKEFGFIDFSDGTCFKHIQVVYDNKLEDFESIQKYHVGSAIKVVGIVIKSQGKGQEFEVQAKEVVLLGECPEDYQIKESGKSRLRRSFTTMIRHSFPKRNCRSSGLHVRCIPNGLMWYPRKRGFLYS